MTATTPIAIFFHNAIFFFAGGAGATGAGAGAGDVAVDAAGALPAGATT